MTKAGDSFSGYDEVLAEADLSKSPWQDGEYIPDWDLCRHLLAIPIAAGQTQVQQSGATAKALDTWIAHELRRAGFPKDAVWPRTRQPRVLPADLGELEQSIDELLDILDEEEKRQGNRLKPASLRSAIKRLPRSLPGRHAPYILGRFYAKQVDVVVSSWERGPDVLVSTKTQFSSFGKNRGNRYEEALGEAPNLRDRYPLTAIGFAFLVRSSIFYEGSAGFELLRDLLIRLRKPDGPFDATMLLVAEWDDESLQLGEIDEPSDQLRASRFFEDLLGAVMSNTPVNVHPDIRARKHGEERAGLPEGDEDLGEDPAALE